MFILGNFIRALAEVINIGLTLFMWIVIAHAGVVLGAAGSLQPHCPGLSTR